jgi:cytidine deaminase
MQTKKEQECEDVFANYFKFEKERDDAAEAQKVNILVYNVTHIDVYFGIKYGNNADNKTVLARATFSKFFETTQNVLNAIIIAKKNNSLNLLKIVSKEGEERLIGFDLSTSPVRCGNWGDFRLRRTPAENKEFMNHPPEIIAVYFPLVAVILPVWLKLLNLPNNIIALEGSNLGSTFQNNETASNSNSAKRKANDNTYNGGIARVVRAKHGSPTSTSIERIASTNEVKLAVSLPTKHVNDNAERTFPTGSVFTTTATSPRRSESAKVTSLKKNYTVVYMTSGSGSPRNQSHSHTGNSTIEAARMLGIFMQSMFPFVHPVSVHSGSGVYRCTHNVTFVNTILRPKIDQHRKVLSQLYGGDWHDNMKIAVALTDGTPARLAAVTASLRNYRPVFLHMWQLKSFWYSRVVSDTDVDTQTFEDWETRPAVGISQLTPTLRSLVNSMAGYKKRFENASHGNPALHELDSFWLRKSKKPVLSVLMIKNHMKTTVDGSVNNNSGVKRNINSSSSSSNNNLRNEISKYKFVYGINSEVSMPTGSLCSERNAIGHALASNPCLKRSDLVAIAVLSVCLDKNDSNHLNPLSPCGACLEWLKKIAEFNPDFKVVMFGDTECKSVFVRSVHGL